MDKLMGNWGLYPWFAEDGKHMIHPSDFELFKQLIPYGKIFYCKSQVNGYIILRYADKTYRVKSELFQIVKPPKFNFYDEVTICNKDVQGIVIEIRWHHGKSEEFYFLNISGKQKSTRYFPNELNLSTK